MTIKQTETKSKNILEILISVPRVPVWIDTITQLYVQHIYPDATVCNFAHDTIFYEYESDENEVYRRIIENWKNSFAMPQKRNFTDRCEN